MEPSMDNAETSVVYLDEKQNNTKRVFLVTLSNFNRVTFPRRMSFGAAVVEAFGANNVEYFVASKEPHETPGKYHYHCAIKLKNPVRWLSAKKYLKENFNCVCNFAVSNSLYAGAYRYATKSDHTFFEASVLVRHPNLDLISKTYERALTANTTYRENAQKRKANDGGEGSSGAKPKKRTRAEFRADLGLFIVENSIKKEIELVALAKSRLVSGDRKLFDYLFNMKKRDRVELVSDAWRFADSDTILREENIAVMKYIMEKNYPCECNEGEWKWCAQNLFERNNIDLNDFREALQRCLTLGRRKHNNLMLVGPTSSGKTFLLKPLQKMVPHVFSNPPGSTFGWMGAENANLVFLNDMRWKPPGPTHHGNISWEAFFNLLEGNDVSLPAAMNVQSEHVHIKRPIPILATSISPITYFVNNPMEPQTDTHVGENRMMAERWVTFTFTVSIPGDEQREVPPCGACFKEFLLQM